jgi:hypothetical protein
MIAAKDGIWLGGRKPCAGQAGFFAERATDGLTSKRHNAPKARLSGMHDSKEQSGTYPYFPKTKTRSRTD